MKITTELKARKLTDSERSYLYNILVGPKREEYNSFKELFKKFLEDLIRRRLITDDIKFITSRPYCIKSGRICIDPEKLGLPRHYEGKYGGETLSTMIGGKFDLPEDINFPDILDAPTSSYRYYRSYNYIDRTEEIVKSCTEDEINQLKDHLIELAKRYNEVEYFGRGTWIRGSSYYRDKFPDIQTWGQLLAKSPELFEELYKNYIDSEEDLEGETGLIEALKRKLGY